MGSHHGIIASPIFLREVNDQVRHFTLAQLISFNLGVARRQNHVFHSIYMNAKEAGTLGTQVEHRMMVPKPYGQVTSANIDEAND